MKLPELKPETIKVKVKGVELTFRQLLVADVDQFNKAIGGMFDDMIDLIVQVNLDDIDKQELKNWFSQFPLEDRKSSLKEIEDKLLAFLTKDSAGNKKK